MLKVSIITAFSQKNDRIKFIYNYFINNGYNAIVICSDFNHHKKTKIVKYDDNYDYIETNVYKKNLSLRRIFSHIKFSKDSFQKVKNFGPDLIYVIIPPNFLAKESIKYKKMNPKVKIIFDLMDVWPESFPIKFIGSKILLYGWKKIRNDALKKIDYLITECDLYQSFLHKYIKNIQTETLYLTKYKTHKSDCSLSCNVLNLCYLGSINHLIDIDAIINLLSILNNYTMITLHIIGDGIKKDILIDECDKIGVNTKFYGIIYSDEEKYNIFDLCNYGINIYKDLIIGVLIQRC